MCRLRCEKLSSTDLWKIQYALSKWLAKVKSLNYRIAIAVDLNRLVYRNSLLIFQMCLPSITKLITKKKRELVYEILQSIQALTFSKPK